MQFPSPPTFYRKAFLCGLRWKIKLHYFGIDARDLLVKVFNVASKFAAEALRILFRALEWLFTKMGKILSWEVPGYSRAELWIQAFLILLFDVAWNYVGFHAGYAITVLAFIAVIMTMRSNHYTKAEQVIWIGIAFVLMVAEIRVIKNEGERADAQRRTFDQHLQNQFDETARGLEAVINQANVQYQGTVGKINQAINTETGGDSFCYLGPMTTTSESIDMAAVSMGNYPLSDVNVTVVDLMLFDKIHDIFASQVLSQSLGNIYAHSAKLPPVGIVFKRPGDTQSLNIYFGAKNGWWTELFRMTKVNGNWKFAMKVIGTLDPQRYPKGAVLFERTDPIFPKDLLDKDTDWKGSSNLKLPKAKYP